MKRIKIAAIVCAAALACGKPAPSHAALPSEQFTPTPEFNNYWNAGLAELSRYELSQARYGNLNRGEMIVIVVTEPFRTDKQVKSELTAGISETPVLKAQLMRRFATGIYDYVITTTSFKSLDTNAFPHALKVSGSAVDWCGHAWLQLNLKKGSYLAQGRSYFEEAADEDFSVSLAISEDEIWQRIRMQPGSLPVGRIQMIPSLSSSRLRHRKVFAETVTAAVQHLTAAKRTEYSLVYDTGLPTERRVVFTFANTFPYSIHEYQETYLDGFKTPKKLTTVARLKKTMRSPYWQQHNPEHLKLRRDLGVTGLN